MTVKQGRICPICFKENLYYLNDHLRQVHQLSSDERKPWLKVAVFSNSFPAIPPYPFWSMQQQTMGSNSPLTQQQTTQRSKQREVTKPSKTVPNQCLETRSYPDFKFNHMFSMLVVGPTQSGKTYFVEKVLTENCIQFPDKKPHQIIWRYNQWQKRYDQIKKRLGDTIVFEKGIPEFSEDLSEISLNKHRIFVFDDLMAGATDSPVLSKLFTQGRHRNASVILLLQNMFPKGKFNTDISRNAQYMVLFKSPSDRKQIDIIAERMFAKDRPHFMKVYGHITAKPYGYVLIDNQPKTTSEKQVISDVFEQCQSYPNISTQPTKEVDTFERNKPSKQNVKKESIKRKVELVKPLAKKPRQTNKPTKATPKAKKPRKSFKPKPTDSNR